MACRIVQHTDKKPRQMAYSKTGENFSITEPGGLFNVRINIYLDKCSFNFFSVRKISNWGDNGWAIVSQGHFWAFLIRRNFFSETNFDILHGIDPLSSV